MGAHVLVEFAWVDCKKLTGTDFEIICLLAGFLFEDGHAVASGRHGISTSGRSIAVTAACVVLPARA